MIMKIALLGYSGSGKTRFVEIAVGKRLETFDPFQPVIVRVKAYDPRLEKLSTLVNAAKTTEPEVEIYDIKGFSRQTGLDDKIISFLNLSDVIVFVIDNFSEIRNPEKDIQSLFLEMIFKDTERLSDLMDKRQQEKIQNKRQSNIMEDAAIKKAASHLENEKPLISLDAGEEEKSFLSYLGLLSMKPVVLLVNGPQPDESLQKFISETKMMNLEKDLLSINTASDISMFWNALWETSNLIVFYTVGEKDTRGWLLKNGASVIDAAAAIHTDIAKGFIRAEVISYNDFIKYESHTACRNANVMHLEPKDYIVADGDVLNIRFSRP